MKEKRLDVGPGRKPGELIDSWRITIYRDTILLFIQKMTEIRLLS
jgi:hypothetical protein